MAQANPWCSHPKRPARVVGDASCGRGGSGNLACAGSQGRVHFQAGFPAGGAVRKAAAEFVRSYFWAGFHTNQNGTPATAASSHNSVHRSSGGDAQCDGTLWQKDRAERAGLDGAARRKLAGGGTKRRRKIHAAQPHLRRSFAGVFQRCPDFRPETRVRSKHLGSQTAHWLGVLRISGQVPQRNPRTPCDPLRILRLHRTLPSSLTRPTCPSRSMDHCT